MSLSTILSDVVKIGQGVGIFGSTPANNGLGVPAQPGIIAGPAYPNANWSTGGNAGPFVKPGANDTSKYITYGLVALALVVCWKLCR